MAVSTASPKTQIADAVRFCRKSRHHPDCRCGMYKSVYCTSGEYTWCNTVSRLLDAVLNAEVWRGAS